MTAGPYLLALAEGLYAERVAERGPAWAQLGETTQSVWIENARRELEAAFGAPVTLGLDSPATNG